MTRQEPAGLVVLHGNRLEQLAEAVMGWWQRHPLPPLAPETVLVPSNGMGEWLKIAVAKAHGICASARVELPGRFLWRAYRTVLGRGAVPSTSPLDQTPLTWRLMALLPTLVDQSEFAPLKAFMAGDAGRCLQLAQRLADLYDQYQVYRPEWLNDWSAGREVLSGGRPVPATQAWQPALWRAVTQTLSPEQQEAARPALHQRFLEALNSPLPDDVRSALPPRLVVLGTTHLPTQTLQALAALAQHLPVLMAVPNPCRHHWADIMDGRELLRSARRRHGFRGGSDLSEVPLRDMHLHGHPLLAAWGRQARDFVRQLDEFDETLQKSAQLDLHKIDYFDESPGETLLEQVQAAVRDLLPLSDHVRPVVPTHDRSIVFQVAHSAQREVEILHDQLLHLLAHSKRGQALAPRDIVVMVPDIDRYAPAIRSVFARLPRDDARYIPYGIADETRRGQHPLMVALEWLMRLPQERVDVSAVRAWLNVPAVAERFGLTAEDLPQLMAWVESAGIRWGLHADHRASLGLGASGEVNTWAFGLRRMLMGYAVGATSPASPLGDIEPCADITGLQARLAGSLAECLQVLSTWWRDARALRTPQEWQERLLRLLNDVLAPSDPADQDLVAELRKGLSQWVSACHTGGFSQAIELNVAREGWLGAFDEPGEARRFRASGVTFCTLMPLRTVPFEVVCLLGMNDGDYPRTKRSADFDLMATPGQARPGDRSRNSDDRQLMLDALLSARRVLSVSWVGYSQRDNQAQPPSVLVSQLRDYLRDGWGEAVVDQRTTEHPLQPFSRRYFDTATQATWFTYAREWQAVHGLGGLDAGEALPSTTAAPRTSVPRTLTIQDLVAFLINPVQVFFRQRLRATFTALDDADANDETFSPDGLETWQVLDDVLADSVLRWEGPLGMGAATPDVENLRHDLQDRIQRLNRQGRLPLAGLGLRQEAELQQTLLPMVLTWLTQRQTHPKQQEKRSLHWVHPDRPHVRVEDWLVGLRGNEAGDQTVCLNMTASKLKNDNKLRPKNCVEAYVRTLVSRCAGLDVQVLVIGRDAVLQADALAPQDAALALQELVAAYEDNLTATAPLPTALNTGLAWLKGEAEAQKAFEGARHDDAPAGEGEEPSLQRLFPDFEALRQHPRFDPASRRLYQPLASWMTACVSTQRLTGDEAGKGVEADA